MKRQNLITLIAVAIATMATGIAYAQHLGLEATYWPAYKIDVGGEIDEHGSLAAPHLLSSTGNRDLDRKIFKAFQDFPIYVEPNATKMNKRSVKVTVIIEPVNPPYPQ